MADTITLLHRMSFRDRLLILLQSGRYRRSPSTRDRFKCFTNEIFGQYRYIHTVYDVTGDMMAIEASVDFCSEKRRFQ